MNVVVICSDTFRYDHLGVVGRQQVFTPNLDQLARESARFTDFWLCSFPTVLNRIEVFTGRYTFPQFNWGRLPFQFPVLAEVFKHHGFVTAFVSDNPHLNKKKLGFARGFDFVNMVRGQTDDRFQPTSAPMIDLPCTAGKLGPRIRRLERYRRNAYWYRQQGTNTAEQVFQGTMRWLDKAPDRFFLWVDSFDPHEPWDAPERYRQPYPWDDRGEMVTWPHYGRASAYSEADLANMRTLYKAEVSQTDRWVGELMNHLRARKRLDQTAVIFCSDHGFYLGEHDLLGKLFSRRRVRPSTIYEEIGHIPLLLRHPDGRAAGQTIPGLCQPPDLFATALDLGGIPRVAWAQGHSLLERLRGQNGGQAFAVGGCAAHKGEPSCLTVVSPEWCFVYTPYEGMDGSELYHRPTDPTQTQNVIAAHPEVAREHFERLTSWMGNNRVPHERQRQLLYATPLGWRGKMKHRLWLLGNRWRYSARYRNYARSRNS
jgi:arylsulfatase A-like enzyme